MSYRELIIELMCIEYLDEEVDILVIEDILNSSDSLQ